MRRVLSICALLAVCASVLISCSTSSSTPQWDGTFTGSPAGTIKGWEFNDNGTTDGTWITSTAISIAIKGTYALSSTGTLSVTASGTATNSSGVTNTYNLYAGGMMVGSDAGGTYAIQFATWGSYSGNWVATKQ